MKSKEATYIIVIVLLAILLVAGYYFFSSGVGLSPTASNKNQRVLSEPEINDITRNSELRQTSEISTVYSIINGITYKVSSVNIDIIPRGKDISGDAAGFGGNLVLAGTVSCFGSCPGQCMSTLRGCEPTRSPGGSMYCPSCTRTITVTD